MMMNIPPICSYCGEFSKLVNGAKVYPHRKDLKKLSFWYCDNGHEAAYVGCHKNSNNAPLVRLADSELRKLKSLAHQAFDPLWKNDFFKSRKEAYKWLAKKLDIAVNDAHIGMFDEAQCYDVISVCDKYFFPENKDCKE